MEEVNLAAIFGTEEEQAPQQPAKDAVSEVLAAAFAEDAPAGKLIIGNFNRDEAKQELALSMFDEPDEINTALAAFDEPAAPPQGDWMAQFNEPPAVKAPATKHKDVRAKSVTEKAQKVADGTAHNVLARKIGSLIQAGDDVDTVVDKCRPNLAEGKYDWGMVMKWAGEHLNTFAPIAPGDVRMAVRDEVILELEEIEEAHLEPKSKAQAPENDGYGQNELLTRTGQNAKNIMYFIPDDNMTEGQAVRKAHYTKMRNRPDVEGWIIRVSIDGTETPALMIETITGPRNNMLAEKYLTYCQQMAKRGQWPRRLQDLMEEEGPADYA